MSGEQFWVTRRAIFTSINVRYNVNFLKAALTDLLEVILLAMLCVDAARQSSAQCVMKARTLNTQFPNRRGGPVDWPTRLPDLATCDYFLWGFV